MTTKKLRYSVYGCKERDEYNKATLEYSNGDYNHPTFLGEYESTWEISLECHEYLNYIFDNKTKKIISSSFGLNIKDKNGKLK